MSTYPNEENYRRFLHIHEIGGISHCTSVSDMVLQQELDTISELLAQNVWLSCIVFGVGGKSKSYFRNLERETGASLVLLDSYLPKIFSFIPSHYAFFRVVQRKILPIIMSRLAEQSTSILFAIPNTLETQFIEAFRNSRDHVPVLSALGEGFEYLVYLLDETTEDPSGFTTRFIFTNASKLTQCLSSLA